MRRWATAPGRRVGERPADAGTLLRLDYPPTALAEPRYGYGRPRHAQLEALLARHDDTYRRELEAFADLEADLLAIQRTSEEPGEAHWDNYWFPHLDPIALYGLLRTRRPAHYMEVGSGHSTMFAARARRDVDLPMTITSIDPQPRAAVDTLCDRVIRAPLERADPTLFDELGTGDVLFMNGSHRVFMNSDATIFFLEVLPRLARGVVVGIHDIFLPADYPPEWQSLHYSEQYLLAAWLLGGGTESIRPLLPCAYLSARPDLSPVLKRFLRSVHFAPPDVPWLRQVPAGVSFWFEMGGG